MQLRGLGGSGGSEMLKDVSTNRCVHLLKRPLNYSIASSPKRHEH